MPSWKGGVWALWILALLAATGQGVQEFQGPLWQEAREAPAPAVPQGLEIFTELAEKLSPAVVNISAVHKEARRGGGFPRFRSPFGERPPFAPDPFREFFERFFGEAPPHARQSLGSGFVIHPSGLILTNDHVIEGAEAIKVILQDERQLEARILGRDPKTDLALLQVEPADPLPAVVLGDSDALRIGEWVMAIGNPFGLSHTVTVGIVSAKGRVIGAGQYDDFIQTDASINPGNSGGPLFNIRGQVVGINTAIIAGGTGIGFAIPINLAKEIVPQLYRSGKVTRGWLGVMIQKITPELAQALSLEEAHGALVTEVVADSPAAQAGIERGDIIVAFDGTGHSRHAPAAAGGGPHPGGQASGGAGPAPGQAADVARHRGRAARDHAARGGRRVAAARTHRRRPLAGPGTTAGLDGHRRGGGDGR
ncbi:MAG: hypothetical protein KatS3mg131_0614 [Candidatus Tectimicrobiota bacterium]|nr:MAG: hypothetical protein KatS3mg131_0614 [Candidatus Tectomicrobia bacterium]